MRGFTLVEMLVVLLLVSLLLLLVPPLFSNSLTRVNMNTQAEKLSVSLRRARSQALARAEPVPWILDVEEHFYQIGLQGKPNRIDEKIQISLNTEQLEVQEEGQKAAIRFYPDGGATGGEVLLQQADYRKKISVDWLTGRIHVE